MPCAFTASCGRLDAPPAPSSTASRALFVDAALRAHLDANAVPFCVIGALAMGAHGFVRNTADIDLLTTDERVLRKEFWPTPPDAIHVGEWNERLAGTVRWLSGIPHDLVVARGHAARLALETAENDASLEGCPVAT